MEVQTQQRLGKNLRMLRHAYGYTQAQVAEAMHIGRTTYTHYEVGRKLPTTDTLVDLARFFRVRVDALFDSRTDDYVKWVFYNERSRQDVDHLIEAYYRLSPPAQGKLLERADALLEGEEEKEI